VSAHTRNRWRWNRVYWLRPEDVEAAEQDTPDDPSDLLPYVRRAEADALYQQLAVAVKALEEIEAYFVGGWPDPDDLPRIRKLGRSGLGKAPWPERGAA
jgi:hypothetical protein